MRQYAAEHRSQSVKPLFDWKKIKDYKEYIITLVALGTAAWGALNYFVTKEDLSTAQCQLRAFIHYNNYSLNQYKLEIEIDKLQVKWAGLEHKRNQDGLSKEEFMELENLKLSKSRFEKKRDSLSAKAEEAKLKIDESKCSIKN